MLPRENRIKKEKEIERVLKQGTKFYKGFLVLKTAENFLGNPRFGFIVSKKVSKKSNVRNQIKRRLRELTRARLKKITRNADILLIAVPGLETKDFQEMGRTINSLFVLAKILNKK